MLRVSISGINVQQNSKQIIEVLGQTQLDVVARVWVVNLKRAAQRFEHVLHERHEVVYLLGSPQLCDRVDYPRPVSEVLVEHHNLGEEDHSLLR